MKALTTTFLLLGHGLVMAETPATLPTSTAILQRAEARLAEGIPSAAVHSLREVLASEPDETEKLRAAELLADALFSTGRFSEVVELASVMGDEASPHLQLLGLEASFQLAPDPELVDQIKALLPELDIQDRNRAIFRLAAHYSRIGDTDQLGKLPPLANEQNESVEGLCLDALQTVHLQQIGIESRDATLYLSGLDELENQQPGQALKLFQTLLQRRGPLSAMAAVGAAESHLQLDQGVEAEHLLENFLQEAGGDADRLPVFEKLDEVYSRVGGASNSELRRLSLDESHPERAREALFYYARSQAHAGRNEQAVTGLRIFLRDVADADDDELTRRVRAELASLLIELGEFAEVLEIVPHDLRSSHAQFTRGVAAYRLGDFAAAQVGFEKALALSPTPFEEAGQNAGLMRIFSEMTTDDEENDGWPEAASAITPENLTAVLLAASSRHPEAGTLLESLASQGSAEAGLALAEWRFAANDLAGANEVFESLPGEVSETERGIYLRVFLADDGTPDANERLVAMAEFFINRFPDSPHLPEVTFKRAEAFFRRGDYLAARQAFEELAVEYPASPMAQAAWFYAGQAAGRLMTTDSLDLAMASYEEAARGGGNLAARSRFEQALVKNALGQTDDALRLLDLVIAAKAEQELTYSALMEKGDTLFALGSKDEQSNALAIATWRQVVTDEAAPARWRNQAACKAGLALARAGDADQALDTFFGILQQEQTGEPEFFWFYKAGFEAARILEERKSWREAVAVYEDLAKVGGPRSDEARARANRLRLENFIWED